jgi:hypothetical protein
MFVSDIYTYCIFRMAPKKNTAKKMYLLIMISVMFLLSWVTCRILPERLPFAADTAFLASGFILTGYLLGERITWLIQKKHPAADGLLLLFSLLTMGWAISSGQSNCMMFINQYGHYGYTLCAAISGCLAAMIVIKYLYSLLSGYTTLKSTVLWYGYHSLAIFPVHLSVKMFIYQMFPLSFRVWYILLPAMFILSIPLVNLITAYFPFMLGQIPFLSPKKHKT